MRSRPALLALVACLAALAGCGVPVNGAATVLDNVPDGLLAPPPRVKIPPPQSSGAFDIYLVFGGRLIAVARPGTPTPQLLLRDLEAGPTPFEQESYGFTTALSGGATIVKIKALPSRTKTGAAAQGEVVTVNLDASVGALPPIALAQIVYTMTELSPIVAVSFYQAGGPVSAPIETGNQYVSRPVTKADYAHFAPAAKAATGAPTTTAPPKCTSTSQQSPGLGNCPS